MGGAGLEPGRDRFLPRLRRTAAYGLDLVSQAVAGLSTSSMPRIVYIEPDGREVALELAPGNSLMRGAMDAGIEGIEAQCGGACSCATCHCYVRPEWLDKLQPPSDDERLMLSNVAAERRPNSRL